MHFLVKIRASYSFSCVTRSSYYMPSSITFQIFICRLVYHAISLEINNGTSSDAQMNTLGCGSQGLKNFCMQLLELKRILWCKIFLKIFYISIWICKHYSIEHSMLHEQYLKHAVNI